MNKEAKVVIIGVAIIYGVAVAGVMNTSDQVNPCVRDRTNADIVQLLSSKAPYISPIPGQIPDDLLAKGTCQVIQAWILIRHGTRYPEKEFFADSKDTVPFIRDKIIDAHEKRKVKNHTSHLCEEDAAALQGWTPSKINESDADTLAPQGKLEMDSLSKRFRQRYPELFRQKAFLNSSMKVRYTDTDRARSSAVAFLNGISDTKIKLPESSTPDPPLRFYKTCQKWKDTVDDNPESLKEEREFKNSKYVKDLLERVVNITGLSSEHVTAQTVFLLYDLCSLETAWSGGSSVSPWCGIFTDFDFRVLEYSQDLEYYWKDGYANDLNLQMACPVLQDLVENLKNKLENIESEPSLILYFTHSRTVLQFGALLDLFKDNVSLRHDNFDYLQDRKWRSSSMIKFGTNLAFILHKCEASDLKVQLLHQEIPIPIPGCTDGKMKGHLCPLETFLSVYNSSLNNCNANAEELCKT